MMTGPLDSRLCDRIGLRVAQRESLALSTGREAQVTFIDSDVLIEHGMGVRNRTIELLEFDAGAFADAEKDG